MNFADEIEDALSNEFGDDIEYYPYSSTKTYSRYFCLKIDLKDKVVLLDIEQSNTPNAKTLEYMKNEPPTIKGKPIHKRIIVYKGKTENREIDNETIFLVSYKDFLCDVRGYVQW